MRVLVTAGPTRESLDPVRYLSNRSSGKFGYALTRSLLAFGHEVVLVSGPTRLREPRGAIVIQVESAQQMLQTCQQHWPQCDAVLGVAAVADYRPAQYSESKLKREHQEEMVLRLTANPDILKTLAKAKGNRLAIGFALESDLGKQPAHVEALRKLRVKGLDYVILNGPEVQGSDRAQVRVFDQAGRERSFGPASKAQVARQLVRSLFGSSSDS